MRTIGFQIHPDRLDRLERAGQLDTAGGTQIDDEGMPLNALAHWQRFNVQSRLVIQTTTALETQLVETDIDDSVMIDKIGTTAPFYCAFAQFGRHHSLDIFEGAYINPVSRKARGQIQIAYIPRSRSVAAAKDQSSLIEASRIERLSLPDNAAVLEHPNGVFRVAGQMNSDAFDAARNQILRIMLVLRIDTIPRRKQVAQPAPWRTRFVTRYDFLEIGANDLHYGIDDRSVPHSKGIHRFRRGYFSVDDSRLSWLRPNMAVINRSDLIPANTPMR